MGGYAPKSIAKINFLAATPEGWVALLQKISSISQILALFSIKKLVFWVVMLRNGRRFSGWACSEFTTLTGKRTLTVSFGNRLDKSSLARACLLSNIIPMG